MIQKLLGFKDHFHTILVTTASQLLKWKTIHGVQKCLWLVLHVRGLSQKFCNFSRLGRVLPRSIKIVGAHSVIHLYLYTSTYSYTYMFRHYIANGQAGYCSAASHTIPLLFSHQDYGFLSALCK